MDTFDYMKYTIQGICEDGQCKIPNGAECEWYVDDFPYGGYGANVSGEETHHVPSLPLPITTHHDT